MRQWKLSAMDMPSYEHWYSYSRARDKDAGSDRYGGRTLAYCEIRRQAPGAAEYHCPYSWNLIPYKEVRHNEVKLPKR